MAFISQPLPPNEQNQNAPTGTTSPNPLALLPPNVAQTGGSSGQGVGSGQASPTQFGTSASKLSDYLSANAPQIQAQASQIAGQLGNQYGKVSGDIGKFANDFGAQVGAGYTPLDQNTITAATSNPAAFARDPNNVKAFQAQANDRYTGPQSFETSAPYAGLQNEISQAVQGANLWSTPGGLQTAIQGVENNPTPGGSALDATLLQMSPQAMSTIASATKPFSNLPGQLTSATTSADQKVTAAQQSAKQASDTANAAIQAAEKNVAAPINAAYQADLAKSQAYNQELNDIAAKISGGNIASLTPDEQKLVGFNPSLMPLVTQYPTIFPTQAASAPINLSSYFTQGQQADIPTVANVETPDQAATISALETLAGNPGALSNLSTAAGTPWALPSYGPSFNNYQPAAYMQASYKPMYDSLNANGWKGVNAAQHQQADAFMQALSNYLNGPQPGGVSPNPPPVFGRPGGDTHRGI